MLLNMYLKLLFKHKQRRQNYRQQRQTNYTGLQVEFVAYMLVLISTGSRGQHGAAAACEGVGGLVAADWPLSLRSPIPLALPLTP